MKQFRGWFDRASPGQIERFGIAAILAVGMVLISFVPSGVGPSRLETGGFGEAGAQAVLPGDSGGAPLPGEEGGAEGTAGLPGGGAGPGAGAAGGTAAVPPGVKLTKSDRGVDETSIKIGFLLVNLRGLEDSGLAPPLRKDIDRVVDAYVDEVNQKGGIYGRKVVAVKRKTEPLSQDDQRAACVSMVRDNQVFGVVDTASNIYEATQRCYGIENKTPYTHSYPLSQEFQAAAGGLDVSANRNLTRIAKEWAVAAKAAGFLTGVEKVGVLTENCPPSINVIRDVFIPLLKSNGAREVVLRTTDCDPGVQQGQASGAAPAFRSEAVTHVFLPLNYVSVQAFLKAADADPTYKFRYFVSDYNGLSADFFMKDNSPTQWDRVRGITHTFSGWKAAGKPTPPEEKACSDILTSRGLDGLGGPDDAEALGICDEFNIMVAALRGAGVNPTRALWAQAIQRLGKVPTGGIPSVTFGPGKFSGGDTVADIEWRRECTCYVNLSDYRQAAF